MTLTTKNYMDNEEEIIMDDMVTVTGTGKSKFLAEGTVVVVHSKAAEKLVEAGKATMGDVVEPAPKRNKSPEGRKAKKQS